MTAASCAHARLVDLHFALRIEPGQEREMRVHLEGCGSCRERYRRRLLLTSLDPRSPSMQERLARGLGLRARRSRRGWMAAFGAGVLAAASLALWARAAPDADFTARGGPGKLPAFVVYRLDASGVARHATEAISPGDELAFAYRNPGGRRFLLLFGTDEHGHVYWFHPGWTDVSQDPAAVPIRPSSELVELPEAIAHRLDGTRLTVHGVLLDSPLGVREVEDRLARGASPLIPGAQEEMLVLSVRR